VTILAVSSVLCGNFISIYKIKNITWPLGDTDFVFSCWKYLSLVRFAHSWAILSPLKDKIRIPAWPCNILYKYYVKFYDNPLQTQLYEEIYISKWFHHAYISLEKSGKFKVPYFQTFATDVYETYHTYTLDFHMRLIPLIKCKEHFQSGPCDKGVCFYHVQQYYDLYL